MSLLVDTNVLLRLTQKHHPHFAVAANAISTLQKRQANLHISHQNLVEFWAVATRPLGSNGLGLTIEQTVSEIEQLRSFIPSASGTSCS
jgi:predicted nucleic acid-binding protein